MINFHNMNKVLLVSVFVYFSSLTFPIITQRRLFCNLSELRHTFHSLTDKLYFSHQQLSLTARCNSTCSMIYSVVGNGWDRKFWLSPIINMFEYILLVLNGRQLCVSVKRIKVKINSRKKLESRLIRLIQCN